MKRERLHRSARLLPISLAAAATVIGHSAAGTTVTWSGSNRVLGTNTYWNGSVLPGPTDEAYFNVLSGLPPSSLGFKGTGATPTVISLAWGSAVFDTPAISSGVTLNIDSSLSTSNTGAATLTLNGDGVATDDIIQLTSNVTGLIDFRGNGATTGSPLTLTLDPGAIDVVNSTATLQSEALVTGSSGIVKVGSGVLYLYNGTGVISTYTGGVAIDNGTVAFNNGNALGNPNNTTTVNAAALEYLPKTANSSGSLVPTRTIDLEDAASKIDITPGNTLTVLGAIIGTGTLNKIDTGTLVLSGTNSYSGETSITAGVLQAGSAADTVPLTSPLGTGGVSDSTTLIFASSQATQVNNSISGSGAVIQNGTGVTTLGAANTYSGGTTVNAGTLVAGAAGALANGPVNITDATLQLGASTGLATVSALSISGNGVLDVGNNEMIVNYGNGSDPITSIAAWLASGYAGGAWNGLGINSSAATATSSSYGVGYADSADPGNPAGLASGTIEIAYTLLGDADLNHIVNGIDFGIVAANFNQGVTSWDQGDFDYSHIVNGIDFGDLAANFNQGANNAAAWAAVVQFAEANGLMADVPEPASIAVLGLAVGLVFRRRRRMI